jgi:hypothetical protein
MRSLRMFPGFRIERRQNQDALKGYVPGGERGLQAGRPADGDCIRGDHGNWGSALKKRKKQQIPRVFSRACWASWISANSGSGSKPKSIFFSPSPCGGRGLGRPSDGIVQERRQGSSFKRPSAALASGNSREMLRAFSRFCRAGFCWPA